LAPSGRKILFFAWTPSQPEYEQMFVAVCANLGIFLLLASRAPGLYPGLILFEAEDRLRRFEQLS